MPDFDPTIPAKVVAPKFDPMGMMQSFQTLQQGALQNRLLGQQIQGKEALGRAFGGATNPQTGEVNWDAAMAALAQDPQGAFQLPEASGQNMQRKIAEAQAKGADLKLTSDRMAKIGETTGMLLTDKAPLTKDRVTQAMVDNLITSGMFKDKESMSMLVDFVTKLPDDDDGIRKALRERYLQSHMTQEGIAAAMGTPTVVDVGDKLVIQRTPGLGGAPVIEGQFAKTLSPSEANTPAYSYYDPATRQTVMVTKAEALKASLGQGKPAGVAQSAPLGTPEAAAIAATEGARRASTLSQAAENVPVRKALLGNLEALVQQFGAGPSADWKRIAGSFVNANNPFGAIFDPKAIASQEEFGKQAMQLAQEQFKALGGTGTDAKLDSTLHTSPSVALSKMGNLGIIRMLKGNEDALAAKNAAWRKWQEAGKGPETYDQFTSQFNKLYDPRVFQSVYMTPAERQTILKGMTADEQKRFKQQYATALQLGWIPGGQ